MHGGTHTGNVVYRTRDDFSVRGGIDIRNGKPFYFIRYPYAECSRKETAHRIVHYYDFSEIGAEFQAVSRKKNKTSRNERVHIKSLDDSGIILIQYLSQVSEI